MGLVLVHGSFLWGKEGRSRRRKKRCDLGRAVFVETRHSMDIRITRLQAIIKERILAVDLEITELKRGLEKISRVLEGSRRLAVCMGCHERLGDQSLFKALPGDLIAEIVRHVEQV